VWCNMPQRAEGGMARVLFWIHEPAGFGKLCVCVHGWCLRLGLALAHYAADTSRVRVEPMHQLCNLLCVLAMQDGNVCCSSEHLWDVTTLDCMADKAPGMLLSVV
jgi:hypothetical protein